MLQQIDSNTPLVLPSNFPSETSPPVNDNLQSTNTAITSQLDNDSTPNFLSTSGENTTLQPTTETTQPLINSVNDVSQPSTVATITVTPTPLQQNYPATRTQNTGYSPLTPPFLSQGFQQPNYPYTQSSYIQNYQATYPTQPGYQPNYGTTFPTQPYSATTNSTSQTGYNYHNYSPQTGYMAHPGVNYANYSVGYGSMPNSYQSEYSRSHIINDGTDKSELKEVLISPDSVIKVDTNSEHVIQKRDRDRRQEKDWNPNLKKRRAEGKKKVVEEPVEPEMPEGDYEVEVAWSDSSLIKKEEGDESTENRYDSVVANGKTYKVGDTIAVWPEGGSKKPAPMGTIKSLYTDGESNNMELCWFYRIEETVHKNNRRHKVSPREVFLSSHIDENPVESIAKIVTIKPEWEIAELDEYIVQPDCYYYKKKYDHLEKVFIDL